ncbi:hypothetical protein V5G24_23025 [Xanthobacter sp. VTT E-85241]|uniref:hypothetical protein n=1 Tax=Roseixanthobacter finlandensis TaxID=3119922 RepID=UPI00372941B7
MQVQLPTGDIAEFPDSMSQADVEAVLRRQFSGTSTGADVVKSAASGVGIGAGMFADALNPVNWVRDLVGNTQALATGDFSTAAPFRGPSSPATELASSIYQPQTKAGEYAQTVATGATTGVVGGIPGVLTGATGAAGGQAGGDAAASTFGEWARPYGGLVGALVGGKAGSSVYNAANKAITRPVETGRAEVNARAKAAYDAVDQSGAQISRRAVKSFATSVQDALKREGYVESAPEYASITRKLNELKSKPQADLTPAGFDAYMKGLDDIAGGSTESARLAGRLKQQINSFLDNVTPAQMRSGTPEDAQLISSARSAWRDKQAFSLADDVERQVRQRAPGTTKQTRARDVFRGIADDEQQMAYLRPEQRPAVERAATTTGGERALREVAKLSPNRLLGFGAAGGALGSAAAGAFNPAFLIPNAIGLAAEAGYRGSVNGSTNAAMNSLRQIQPSLSYATPGGMIGYAASEPRPTDEYEGLLRFLFNENESGIGE